jgi:hypothetical protein
MARSTIVATNASTETPPSNCVRPTRAKVGHGLRTGGDGRTDSSDCGSGEQVQPSITLSPLPSGPAFNSP